MTENDMTGALFAYIRKEEPDSFVWKIHDDYRGGITDGLLIVGAPHTWLEAKKLRSRKQDPCDMLSALQRKTIEELARLGQTVIVVGYVDNWRTVKVYQAMYDAHFGAGFFFERVHDDTTDDWTHGRYGSRQECPPTRGRVHPVLQLLRWRRDAQSSATVVPAA